MKIKIDVHPKLTLVKFSVACNF